MTAFSKEHIILSNIPGLLHSSTADMGDIPIEGISVLLNEGGQNGGEGGPVLVLYWFGNVVPKNK